LPKKDASRTDTVRYSKDNWVSSCELHMSQMLCVIHCKT
jgi:hypothetical protein